MSSLLSVRNDRHSRSKSPGGRDRDRDRDRSRSHSRDTRAKSPPKEYKRSSKKYSDSESETESEDERYRRRDDKRSSKRYDVSDDDRRRPTKSSRNYEGPESEESEDHKSSRLRKEQKSRRDVSDDDRRRDDRKEKVRKNERKRSDSESELERRKSRDKDKKSKKKIREPESSGSEDSSTSKSRKTKNKKDDVSTNSSRTPSYVQPTPYAYPPEPAYAQPYASGYPQSTAPGYPDTRPMNYDSRGPQYAPPGAFPVVPPVPEVPRPLLESRGTSSYHGAMPQPHRTPSYSGPPVEHHRAPSYSGPVPEAPRPIPEPHRAPSYNGDNPGGRYAEVNKFQYAQPGAYKYTNPKETVKPPDMQYPKTYNARSEPQFVEARSTRPDEHIRPREKRYADDNYARYGNDDRVREKRYTEDRYDQQDQYHEDRRERREKVDDKSERRERYGAGKDEKRNMRDDGSHERRPSKLDDPRDLKREKSYHDDTCGSSPDDLSHKISHLTVGGALGAAGASLMPRRDSHSGGKPPSSPLLEAYKGTYQSISPMPSPLALANHKDDSELSDMDLDSDSSISDRDPDADLKRKIRKLEKEQEKFQRERLREKEKILQKEKKARQELPSEMDKRSRQALSIENRAPDYVRGIDGTDVSLMVISPDSKKKAVSFYDPTDDAKKVAKALQGTHHAAETKPLIQILPGLSTDDLFALRAEYKNHAKVAGQGINIAKHIKMRVPGNLGKAAYATALGRWESEAYWANSWYQGGASRRELLIESLMGRHNSDIREIKNCFKDKRYGDDLEKCMKAELKADKFRAAILLALEERRMPESTPLDTQLIKQDVQDLARALASPGGESAMIQVIVLRSDHHLREVLKVFERTYSRNFAREMITKSRNLVVSHMSPVEKYKTNPHSGRDTCAYFERCSEPSNARCIASPPSHFRNCSG